MADEFVYDSVNETLVIGACLVDETMRKRLSHTLSTSEFLEPRHSLIWTVVRELNDRNLKYEPETVRRLITNAGGDEQIVEYVENIRKISTVPENIDFHVSTLSWDALRARALKGSIPEFFEKVKDQKAAPEEVVSAARSVLRSFEGAGRVAMTRGVEVYRNYRAELAARRVTRNVYPLGYEAFDNHLSEGFMPRRTTVTAGLPGSGKSTVWFAKAIQLAKLGRKPLWCAWEMDPESVLDVGCAHMTGIPLKKIIQGTLTDEEASRIDQAARWILSRIKFMRNPFLRASPNQKKSNDRNLDSLEGYLAESGCDVVIYDLWERMLAYRDPDDVTGALYRMQDMHQEYNVHGVIVHQLRSKDVEARADKRPTREAIKGTGAYVEVADLIFGIHRDAQFKKVPDDGVECICLKQRKGETNWAVRFGWDGATCKVSEPEDVPYDPGLESSDFGDIGRVRKPSDIKTGKRRDG